MEPISRAQLLIARAAYIAEQERRAYREQELRGQLAAEEFYKDIRRIAENNKSTRATSSAMQPGVAFDSMLFWTKEHFPDCDVTTAMISVDTWAVVVDWSPKDDNDLHARRLEKETSW
jgi:hypothetical protein